MDHRVYVVTCLDYDHVEERLVELLTMMGGMAQFASPGETIVLKPNLLQAAPPERAITTHPAVVAAVAKAVKGAGATAESLRTLHEKLDWIGRRLNYVETVLAESQQYPEVVGFLRSLRIGTALYGEPLKTLDRLVSARRLIDATSQKDEISRIIINTISLKGPQNLSQLTRHVQYQRGKASRTTVRKRVKKLLEKHALIKDGHYYSLAPSSTQENAGFRS